MANSEQTKRALADGLKLALNSQEFDRITVADITDCSEVSRNTFYYHFRDKQELVDWIFHTDLGPVLRNGHPGRTWNEALTELLERLQRSRAFYAGILRNQGQDRFSNCLFGDCYEMVCALLAQYLRESDPGRAGDGRTVLHPCGHRACHGLGPGRHPGRAGGDRHHAAKARPPALSKKTPIPEASGSFLCIEHALPAHTDG